MIRSYSLEGKVIIEKSDQEDAQENRAHTLASRSSHVHAIQLWIDGWLSSLQGSSDWRFVVSVSSYGRNLRFAALN
jgi:hypothetical protein